jgi:hypothetical protein
MPICAWYASTKREGSHNKPFLIVERSAFRFAASILFLYSSGLVKKRKGEQGTPTTSPKGLAIPRVWLKPQGLLARFDEKYAHLLVLRLFRRRFKQEGVCQA